ncbi:hypothetical protein OIU78_007013, partial [Salix suchowensis]
MRIPIVLYFVVCTSRQSPRYQGPPESKTCSLRNRTPTTLPVFSNVICEFLVFLLRPSSLVSVLFITAMPPHYLDTQFLKTKRNDSTETN